MGNSERTGDKDWSDLVGRLLDWDPQAQTAERPAMRHEKMFRDSFGRIFQSVGKDMFDNPERVERIAGVIGELSSHTKQGAEVIRFSVRKAVVPTEGGIDVPQSQLFFQFITGEKYYYWQPMPLEPEYDGPLLLGVKDVDAEKGAFRTPTAIEGREMLSYLRSFRADEQA